MKNERKIYQLVDEQGKYYSLYKIFNDWNHKVTDKKKEAIVYTEKELNFAKECYEKNGYIVHEVIFKQDYKKRETPIVLKPGKKMGRPKKQII